MSGNKTYAQGFLDGVAAAERLINTGRRPNDHTNVIAPGIVASAAPDAIDPNAATPNDVAVAPTSPPAVVSPLRSSLRRRRRRAGSNVSVRSNHPGSQYTTASASTPAKRVRVAPVSVVIMNRTPVGVTASDAAAADTRAIASAAQRKAAWAAVMKETGKGKAVAKGMYLDGEIQVNGTFAVTKPRDPPCLRCKAGGKDNCIILDMEKEKNLISAICNHCIRGGRGCRD